MSSGGYGVLHILLSKATQTASKGRCIQGYTFDDKQPLESVWKRLSACFSFMVLWCHLHYALKRSRMACKAS